jgi:hypothetical protein
MPHVTFPFFPFKLNIISIALCTYHTYMHAYIHGVKMPHVTFPWMP